MTLKYFPALVLGLTTLVPNLAVAGSTDSFTVANNTPKFVRTARKVGAVQPSTNIEVSIWLKPHNKAALDAMAKDLYSRDSPNYRHWLTKAQFSEKFAPTAEEARTVSNFFAAHQMKVLKVGPDNFFIRASGTASAVANAFHVSLDNYEVNGKIVRANNEDPTITGEAASLVGAVAGLDTLEYTHPVVTTATRRNPTPSNGGFERQEAARPALANAAQSLPFNPVCFPGQTTQTFTTDGDFPKATYKGNEYTPAAAGCGYTPNDIHKAYGLDALYKEGFDGKGQTIVIIDWCGSPTITADANAFSAQFGLPKLTDKNFHIIYTPTKSHCMAPDPEINLDVEWAHAIAPGASIDLVVPPSGSFQDIDQGLFYAVDYQLGSTISGSFGSAELYTDPTVLITEDLILEIAAVTGISAQFSTGDYGDFTFDDPMYEQATVSSPASSPYATGVGGVSLALNKNGTIAGQVGWGTNENLVSAQGEIEDPPAGNGFFNFGSGGGESGFFYKPSYQAKLPGIGRQLPDISWLGDPFTGAYIAISEPGVLPELQYSVIGGTSLSCPMFTALWAIANQEAGQALGQAAPYLYSMPKGTITDILPYSSSTSVKGTVTEADGTKTNYSAASLVEPLEGQTQFLSALWDVPLYQDTAYIVTFGTDSGLTVTPGWDNVTGLGVPNPKAFADAFKQ